MSATFELDLIATPDAVDEVTLDLHLPVSADSLVAITHALGRLDPDAVLCTDSPEGVARLVVRVDTRKARRAYRRREQQVSA